MRTGAIIAGVCLAASAVMAAQAAPPQATVRLNTSDGCRLEAFYQAPSSGSLVLVNVHGLGSDKNEWAPFQRALAEAGYGYLSLDLRGHGRSRSCGGRKAEYTNFTQEDWNKASLDIEAAAAWLKKRGLPPARQVFCGASVGANLVIKAAAEGAYKPAAVIMLSPGLEYAGVKSEPYFTARRLFPALLAASQQDSYAWYSSMTLGEEARAKGLRVSLAAAVSGHGVNMFQDPRVIPYVLQWLSAVK